MGRHTEIPLAMDDGARSTLTVYDHDALGPTAPLLLALPAMGVRAGFYHGLAEPLADAGLRLAAADLRGHGLSSLRPGREVDFGYREMLELDLPATVAALRHAYPDAAIVMLGHSLGGQLSLLYAAAKPGAVDAVVTVASCSVYWAAYPLPDRFLILPMTQLIALLGRVLGSYPGHRLGFAGHEARSLVADWAGQGLSGRYRPRGSAVDYEAALASLRPPALLITVAGDRFAPASAADHLRDKLPPARLTRLHLADERLRGGRNPHFGWVGRSAPVVEAIAAWLGEQGLPPEHRGHG